MREYYLRIRSMAFSNTARDTYVLFVGNLLSAFWGFLFTLFVARALSLEDFGIFSAALNLVAILASLADIGISTGSVNFIAEALGKNDRKKADEYIKASFMIRIMVVLVLSLVILLASAWVARNLLATNDYKVAIWAAVVPIFFFPAMFFPPILQAKSKFLESMVVDNVFYIARLLFVLLFYIIGGLTISHAFWAFGAGFVVQLLLTAYILKFKFLYSKPKKHEYLELLKFSGWVGVNRIISSVSGKLDVQMLAAMIGALATGLYSIPSRLASFIVVLASSYSAVLATRFASFADKKKEKEYLVKSSLALLPIILGIVVWIVFAKPFILLLFGQKYLESVPVFQALTASQIPFLLTVPSVSAIVYSMKKTIYIGMFSFFQIAAIFVLNLFLIPVHGPYGPTITLTLVNIVLAIYTWVIVIKYYWYDQPSK